MRVHRQIFAASELLEKKIALPKVIEITQAASTNLEAGLDIPEPSTAVMASELYENRAIAAAGGQYINVPNVPRATLSAVLRGRIEEIGGWAASAKRCWLAGPRGRLLATPPSSNPANFGIGR